MVERSSRKETPPKRIHLSEQDIYHRGFLSDNPTQPILNVWPYLKGAALKASICAMLLARRLGGGHQKLADGKKYFCLAHMSREGSAWVSENFTYARRSCNSTPVQYTCGSSGAVSSGTWAMVTEDYLVQHGVHAEEGCS
eukprot:5300153-Amphidinium_carterae.1